MPYVNLILICDRCGDAFSAHRPTQRYCSTSCAGRSRREIGCGAPECARRAVARGCCDMHYRRLLRTGSIVGRLTAGSVAWVHSRIDIDGECWLWRGEPSGGGYCQVNLGDVHPVIHRVVYEIMVGPIPAGLDLDHLCNRRRCVRPAHLEPVTHAENMRRAFARRRRGASGMTDRRSRPMKAAR